MQRDDEHVTAMYRVEKINYITIRSPAIIRKQLVFFLQRSASGYTNLTILPSIPRCGKVIFIESTPLKHLHSNLVEREEHRAASCVYASELPTNVKLRENEIDHSLDKE